MSSGRLLGGIAIGLVLVACTNSDSATTVSGIETTVVVTSTTTVPTTDLSPGDTVPFDDVPPLARYLAAIDRGLMGTEYEGDVYLDPEGYISVGRLFCSLLEADVSPTGVLETYISSLEANGELSDDDLVLGGVILGASVQLICPDYLDDLRALQDQ
jgi:hypothetical protein